MRRAVAICALVIALGAPVASFAGCWGDDACFLEKAVPAYPVINQSADASTHSNPVKAQTQVGFIFNILVDFDWKFSTMTMFYITNAGDS